MSTLSLEAKRRLVRDFALPVPVLTEPHFTHFLDLSDEVYQSHKALTMLKEAFAMHGGERGYMAHRDSVSRTMTQDMTSTDAWKSFVSNDVTKKMDQGRGWQKETLYQQDFAGMEFVSLDMKKANFQALKFLNPEYVLGAKSYEELLSRYTDCEYLMKNKAYRQFFFGFKDLLPKRQARAQKALMFRVYEQLNSVGLNLDQVFSASNDELVLRVKHSSDLDKAVLVQETVKSDVDLTLEHFVLEQVHPVKSLFVKRFDDGSYTLKKVEKPLVPEVLRYLKGEEPNEADRFFMFDARVSQFQESLY